MITEVVLIGILLVCAGLLVVFIKTQLKADNDFYYLNGRSMRPLDIMLAIDRDKFDYRIGNLTEPTRELFRKWLNRDMQFSPIFHLSVAILLYFSRNAYGHPGFQSIIIFLLVGQVISLLAHWLSDVFLLNSLKKKKMEISMRFFNALVVIKLVVPVLGLFIGLATLILLWFRLLNNQSIPWAALIFILPVVLLSLVFLFKK